VCVCSEPVSVCVHDWVYLCWCHVIASLAHNAFMLLAAGMHREMKTAGAELIP